MMAWLTPEEKDKLIKRTDKKYALRRFLLFLSIFLLIAVIGIMFFSFLKTIITYTQLHNDGKTSAETWIEISHNWWSPVKVLNEAEYQPGQSIFITFSLVAYIVMGVFGFTFLMTIISIILVATMKSPRKVTPDVQALDDDYWKHQISKLNRIHNLEVDAWQEFAEVQKMRDQDRTSTKVKIKINSPTGTVQGKTVPTKQLKTVSTTKQVKMVPKGTNQVKTVTTTTTTKVNKPTKPQEK